MRPSSLAFALACAIALPSGAALVGYGYAVCLPLIGVGLGIGLGIMGGLDMWDFLRGRSLELDDLAVRTWHSRLAAEEIEQRLTAPTTPEIQPATPPDTSDAWRKAAETFLLAGEVRGFSARKLAGVVGSDGWPIMKSWLEEQEILTNYGQGRGYAWADGMTLAKALTRLRAGLPHPDGYPPQVDWAINNATLQARSQRSATVDSTARAAD